MLSNVWKYELKKIVLSSLVEIKIIPQVSNNHAPLPSYAQKSSLIAASVLINNNCVSMLGS